MDIIAMISFLQKYKNPDNRYRLTIFFLAELKIGVE